MNDALLGLPDRSWIGSALSFNFDPAAYVHDSWLDSLTHGNLVRKLRENPHASTYVSQYLQEALGLKDQYWYDFSNFRARLALLDGQALDSLFLHTGLWLRNGEIQQEMRGDRIRNLRRSLTEQEILFAVKRAPFLGRVPDFPAEPHGDDLRARFSMIGGRFCTGPLAAVDAELARRLVIKLPRTWSSYILGQGQSVDQSDAGAGVLSLIRKLSKEILPRWSPLFA